MIGFAAPELSDRHIAAIEETQSPDEESSAAVWSTDSLPYVADSAEKYEGDDKVESSMQ